MRVHGKIEQERLGIPSFTNRCIEKAKVPYSR
jgi:hypothetical protein